VIKEASAIKRILNLMMGTARNKIKNSRAFVAMILLLLVCAACNHQSSTKNKIHGKWHSEDRKTGLIITQKEFTLNEGEEPIAESYFVKGDSIFTSYEGSRPYTKFVIKNLSDKTLTLVYPDSTSVNFVR